MVGIIRSLKRVLTGQVVSKSDLQIMDGSCTVSLRMKRDATGVYVVLASIASGNAQYLPFDPNEFEKFAAPVTEMRDALRSENGTQA